MTSNLHGNVVSSRAFGRTEKVIDTDTLLGDFQSLPVSNHFIYPSLLFELNIYWRTNKNISVFCLEDRYEFKSILEKIH